MLPVFDDVVTAIIVLLVLRDEAGVDGWGLEVCGPGAVCSTQVAHGLPARRHQHHYALQL